MANSTIAFKDDYYECISEKMTLAKLDCPTTLSIFISNLLYGSCVNKILYG